MPEPEKHSWEKDPEIAALQKQHQGKAFDKALLATAKQNVDVRILQERIRKLEADWSDLKDHLYEASLIVTDDLHEMVNALTKDCDEARLAKSDSDAVVDAARSYLEAKDAFQGVDIQEGIGISLEAMKQYQEALSELRKALAGYMA